MIKSYKIPLTYVMVFLFLNLALLSSCNKKNRKAEGIKLVTTSSSNDLHKIMFINENRGYIAGGQRYLHTDILETQDGGESWTPVLFSDPLIDKAVYGLCHLGDKVFAAGFNGKFFYYPNYEDTWGFIQCIQWEAFTGISFVSPNKGFITYGLAFHTGGLLQIDSSCNILKLDTFGLELADVQFVSEKTGYISGYGAILKTTDGGESWDFLNIQGDFFKSLSCPDQQHIWGVGYNGSIVHSPDAGKSWIKQRNGNNPLLPRWRLRSIKFKDLRTGYAVGDKGLIIKTSDGGKKWERIESGCQEDFLDIEIQNDNAIWVVGTNGIVLKITT